MHELLPLLTTNVLEFLIIGSALLRAFLLNVHPKRYFADQGYVSWFSFLQIIFASYLAWKIYKTRKATVLTNNTTFSLNNYKFWAILSLGFLFLSLDEMLQIHEKIDFLIHDIFQLQKTSQTDRIDGLIVLLYALCGGGIVYWAKSELRKLKLALPLFSLALFATFLMIFLDLITDSRDIVYWIINDNIVADEVQRLIGIAEECCKIIAEGIFIVTFHRCLEISKNQKYLFRQTVK
ncbi:MAG: hypothetical protein AAGM40_29065 [Cyanobacteria bacterium J06573_2]